MARPYLTEQHRVPTSGARAVEAFGLAGESFLAIPQLATDVAGAPAHMNGGDSDTEALVLRRSQHGYVEHQRLTAPGGEDAEFFRIGDRAFLALASVRRGAGPYEYALDSRVFEWDGDRFAPFQAIPTVAAKQWRHFAIEDRHFLALAQGVTGNAKPSAIYAWDGAAFVPFQEIPSEWGYNWHPFVLAGRHFLAYADHARESVLYRWDGRRFVEHQPLAERHGRAFATFEADGETYLVCARIQSESEVFRWDGRRFARHQTLDGLGARELAVVRGARGLYLARVNFILGSPDKPTTDLESQLYRWQDGRLELVETFRTLGATDVVAAHDAGGTLLAVSSGLSADVRFRADTIVYRFDG